MRWKSKYKCRMCQISYYGGGTITESIARKAVNEHAINEEEKTVDIIATHYCENGSYGISDFIGMEKEENHEQN